MGRLYSGSHLPPARPLMASPPSPPLPAPPRPARLGSRQLRAASRMPQKLGVGTPEPRSRGSAPSGPPSPASGEPVSPGLGERGRGEPGAAKVK